MSSGGVNCSVSLPVGIQMLGENAPSQLILYHYPDLKEEKGVVLMTAEMDPKFIVSPAVLTCVDLTSVFARVFPIIFQITHYMATSMWTPLPQYFLTTHCSIILWKAL